MKIIHEIFEKITGISKPKQKFIENLLCTILSMGGRMNFRNMARYTNYHEKTFSRNFAKEFDYLKFNITAVNRVVSKTKRYGIGYDPFFIAKSGKHTYGRESFWNGSKGESEMGLEGNGFALIDIDTKTAYPLVMLQTPPKDEIRKLLEKPDATRMDFYVYCMESQLQYIKFGGLEIDVKHLITDAYFCNEKCVTMAFDNGYHSVGKLRCNANLRFINFEKKEGRGRPRKYAGKVNVKDLQSYTFTCKIDDRTDLYEGEFYSINLKRIIRVACLVCTYKNKQGMELMYSTDLNLTAKDIYEFYSARFQIEFVFRDGKQFVGLSDCQARSKTKIHNHLNASATALLLAKIQDAEARPPATTRMRFSMESHKRINYNEMLTKRIISNLGFDVSLIKLHPGLQSIIELGAIRC